MISGCLCREICFLTNVSYGEIPKQWADFMTQCLNKERKSKTPAKSQVSANNRLLFPLSPRPVQWSMQGQHQRLVSLLFFFIYSAEKNDQALAQLKLFSLHQVPKATRHEIRSFLNNPAHKCDQKRPTMESYMKYGLHQIDNVGEMSKRQMFGFEFYQEITATRSF